MKPTLSLLIMTAFLAGASCKKKDKSSDSGSYTPECSGAAPKYAANVAPLIQANCNTASCHALGSMNGPGGLTTYASVKNSAASIRTSIVSGSMPKNSSLSTEQRNAIVCWIDAGANND
jgi:hypothetical protein